MEKVHIFIDGANFYHLVLKKLGIQETQFDFDQFAIFLANGRIIPDLGKRFYIGTIREKEGDLKSKEMMSRQTELFTNLKSGKWEIKTSKLRTRKEKIKIDNRVNDWKKLNRLGIFEIEVERMREKGIDVKLATDLIVGAFDKKYDSAIIISSDGDLIPAVDLVRLKLKRKVEYIGFSISDPKDIKNNTTPLLSMISRTDRQRTLIESDLKPFIKEQKRLFNNQ